jgi:RNA polymerase sigma factor (sigma-70 family)
VSRQQLDTVLQRVRSVAGRRPPAADTDPELLDRFATARDEAAFEALVARHYPMVLGVCRRVVNHAEDAEDACQATFLALARQAATVRRREALAGWLYRVARRIALKTRTSAVRRAARADAVATAPAAVEATPDVTWREALAVLDEELVRMPAAYRSALVLCYLEGKTQDEAARQLGRSLGALRGQLERGREKLRARLLRRGVSLAALFGVALNQHVTAGPPASAVARVTLQYAGQPSAVPARVAALAGQGAKVMITAKAKLGAVLILAAGILAVSLHVTAQPGGTPGGAEKRPDRPAPAATDTSGDPLPTGAVLRLGTTRLRHAGLSSLAFTADGSLVSFGADKTVRVWKPTTGQLLRQQAVENDEMHRHRGGCLSPDGQRVAVQVLDRMKVFDTASGKELASVRLLSSYEARARFSPNGHFLAVIDQDGKFKTTRLQLCDVETNGTREVTKLRGYFSAPAFSRDGRRLAVAEGNPHGVGVWDVATGKELLGFSPAGLLGGYVDFDPTGDVLAVLGAINPPQQIHYVRISTGQAPEGWTVPPVSEFEWVRFSPDGSAILFGGRQGIQWCDPKTGKVTFAADGWAATPPTFSADGRFVAAGGENAIRLWDVSSGKPTPVQKQDTGADEIDGLAVSPDGKWFVTKDGGTGTLQVWDAAGRLKADIKSQRSGGRYPLFSPDGKYLLIGAADAIAIVRRDFPDGKETMRYTFDEPAADHIYIYHIGLSADGKRLAAFTQTSNRGGGGAPGGAGGPGRPGREVATLTVWDVATGRRLASRPFDSTYTETSGLFGYGAFTPDLRWYFGGDKAIALADDADLRLELPAGWSFPRQAAISPDGRLVAQVIGEPKGQDQQVEWKRIFVHEVATGKLVAMVPAGFCGPIAFTPEGRGLITTNPDAITRWDLATRQPVVRHKSPAAFKGNYGNSFASSLIVTPDGTRAVTGQRDTTALVWDLKAPARKARKLTEREVAAAWDDLAGDDAAKAYQAVWALADGPSAALPFLRGRLRPAAPATGPSDKQAAALIAQLDAPAFATREAAEKELRGFGDAALPALRTALEGKPSGEQRERLKRLVTAATSVVPTVELLQQLRAVAALEQAGTAEAKTILKELAGGAAGRRLTVEASAALARSR